MLKTAFTAVLAITTSTVLGACDMSETRPAATALRGEAAYRDAGTDHAGNPHRVASPGHTARFSFVLRGNGEFSPEELPSTCALDPAGQFQAIFTGATELGSGSAYVAAIAGASVITASGCQVPELTSMLLVDARVRAEIDATTLSCTPYCSASARADAESECGTLASAAQCRASAEAELRAECASICTTRADRIVAETSLAVSLFGDVEFEALRTAALGDLEANLTFDHLEDADGARF